MKKQLFMGFFAIAAVFGAFAGDAAAFVDMGMSSDGKTYVFGEYGKTDKSFQGYAEIYTVNIEKNDFVSGGVFKTAPSSSTVSKSGRVVFDELQKKAGSYLKRFNLRPINTDNLLYYSDESKSGTSDISFKDFEGSTTEKSFFYHIKLTKTVEGSGSNMHSSFFITMEKKDESGYVISKNIVGSPDIKRKCVSDYRIDRIFSDPSGRNIVFVIEKTVRDGSGTSIRYMVETVRL